MATDAVVLTDGNGDYYLISKELIEHAKVTDAKQKQELEESAKGDTSGFSLFQQSFSPIALSGAQFKLVGACSCSFQFTREGYLAR